ncbi:hypothetical protein [Thermoactinospora rubra]|uniref:hypothetical protein n=1 Tax=Thermoactinospora rubra TaxID=1088767 RepID=UPI000A1142DC|nr:hypothetical protein [Thermoactinospora rubra]
MPIMRVLALALLAAPVLSVLLQPSGQPELAGVLTGVGAGWLLCGEPARAAMATLCGSASAVFAGSLIRPEAGPDFSDEMAGWPGWPAGAVLTYLLADGGRLRQAGGRGRPDGPARPAALPVCVAALAAAALGCGLLLAAKALGATSWEEYHPYDAPGWYRDLTGALWYPAAAVVIAAMLAGALPGGRGRFLALPLGAWLGCAVTAGPLQYAQALGVPSKPAAVALLASLAGGSIGAAAAAAGLRHAGTRLGLAAHVLLFTAVSPAARWLRDPLPVEDVVRVAVTVALVAWVAARAASRDAAVGSGVVAGMAGPLLVWSVYLTVGSRHYDHLSQAEPYWLAWAGVPVALVTAVIAAGLATGGPERAAVRAGTGP